MGRISVQGGELTISAASVKDAGVYKCVVDNGRSTDQDFTTVKIKFPGRIFQFLLLGNQTFPVLDGL